MEMAGNRTISGTFNWVDLNLPVLAAMMATQMTGCPGYVAEDPRKTTARMIRVRQRSLAFRKRLVTMDPSEIEIADMTTVKVRQKAHLTPKGN